jgi:high-affinity nickel-transport protein
VVVLTLVWFGLLFAAVISGHHQVNGQVFGIGLGITAYLLGVGTHSTPSRRSTT